MNQRKNGVKGTGGVTEFARDAIRKNYSFYRIVDQGEG